METLDRPNLCLPGPAHLGRRKDDGGRSQQLRVGKSRVPRLRRWGEVWGQVSGRPSVPQLYLNDVVTGQRRQVSWNSPSFLAWAPVILQLMAGVGLECVCRSCGIVLARHPLNIVHTLTEVKPKQCHRDLHPSQAARTRCISALFTMSHISDFKA